MGQGSARVTATTRAIYNSVKNKITIGRPLLSIRRLPPHVRIAIGPEIQKITFLPFDFLIPSPQICLEAKIARRNKN